MPNPQRSIPAAVTLFFVAPLVAEFLLGDFPVTWLPLLLLLAPMYGGGAILIRELARRSGRGWPTILLLGCAYALIEEGFVGQTLFNPDIFGKHMHLLTHAWIPSLGIGTWWTLFMLNVHPFWSIGVSIALVDGLFPSRVRTPWLGKVGVCVAAALYLAGAAVNAAYSLHHDPFRASNAQFAITVLICILLVIAAFLTPARTPQQRPGAAPSPWLTGSAAFLLGAAIFLAPILWNWGAVVLILAVDLAFLASLWVLSRRDGWTALHTLSVGAGGALVYGVHAFIGNPVVPSPKGIVLLSHVVFLILALALIAIALRRTQRLIAAG
ncbi:MAG: hypothetical protein ABSF23_11945 [Terracidiphilus sp.]|jgi:hypothetical protein